MVLYACNSRTSEAKWIGWSLRLTGQPAYPTWWVLGQWKTHLEKKAFFLTPPPFFLSSYPVHNIFVFLLTVTKLQTYKTVHWIDLEAALLDVFLLDACLIFEGYALENF